MSLSNNNNQKFYYKTNIAFDEGEKFLFEISSIDKYNDFIVNLLVKNRWDFPLEGKTRLFGQVKIILKLKKILLI